MSLFRIVSDINGHFRQKSQFLPTPCFLTPSLSGFSLELGNMGRPQKEDGATRPRKICLTIYLGVWIQYTSVMGRETDRRTGTGRQLVPRLRIASRCKDVRRGILAVTRFNWVNEGIAHRYNQFNAVNQVAVLSR